MPRYLVLVGAALLSGCGLLGQSPSTPQPADVTATYSAIQAMDKSGMTPIQAFNVGEYAALQQCDDYLGKVTGQENTLEFAASETTLLTAVGTGIAAALQTSPLYIAISGLVGPAISQSLVSAGKAATAGLDASSVYKLVQDSEANVAAAVAKAPPGDMTVAAIDIAQFAEQCELPAIRAHANEAIAAAKASTAPAPASAPASTAAAPKAGRLAEPAIVAPAMIGVPIGVTFGN